MAPHNPFDDDDDDDIKSYHESSDDDFNPTAAPADESSASEDEDEITEIVGRKGKRKVPQDQEFDSGDEATIETAKKRNAKRHKGNDSEDEQDDGDVNLLWSDNEGGEGGLVKTRAQRRVEQKERRPLARTDGATVDVDALWATMSATPLWVVDPTQPQNGGVLKEEDVRMEGATISEAIEDEGDLVSIRKTYVFAGQSTSEDKQVPRSALEKHLSDGWKAVDNSTHHIEDPEAKTDAVKEDSEPKARRPPRRRSRYDPNPTGYVRALPPEHQLSWPRKTIATGSGRGNMVAPEISKIARPEKAQKLNVVDKSRLDWTGFVNKEGIAEELDVHGKTKEAYLGRMDFLAGVEARQEEERRKMKITTAS